MSDFCAMDQSQLEQECADGGRNCEVSATEQFIYYAVPLTIIYVSSCQVWKSVDCSIQQNVLRSNFFIFLSVRLSPVLAVFLPADNRFPSRGFMTIYVWLYGTVRYVP